MKKKNGTN